MTSHRTADAFAEPDSAAGRELESEFEHSPVPESHRKSLLTVSAVWFGFPMILTNAVPGGLVVAMLGFWQGLAAIVVANLIMFVYVSLLSYRAGRELYAMGSNPDAARLAGIPIGRRVFVAFTVSGAIAGVAGVLWAAQYGTIDSTAGTGYELQVISAVVVGGVAIFGGSGSAVGAALGALLLNTISSALYVLGISPFWNQAIFGFLLLLAITLDRFISVRLTAALRVRGARHE